MGHTQLRQHSMKRILKLTCICWLIAMSSAITLFPAHSKDSNTLSEPLKAFIDEQLNKQPGAMLVDMNEHGITRSTKAKPARYPCTQQPLESEVALMSLDKPFIGPTDNAVEWAA